MAFKVKFENGKTVIFDSRPSQADIDEVAAKMNITKTEQPAPQQPTESPQSKHGVLANLGIGIIKGVGSTLAGASTLGEKMLQAPLKAVGVETQKPLGQEIKESGRLTPEGTAQKIGFGAEQVAEYFIPGGAPAKAAKATSAALKLGKTAAATGKAVRAAKAVGRVGVRAGVEGLTVGGQAALQSGSLKEGAQVGAGAAAFVPALKGAGAVTKAIMPATAQRFINSLIKPLQRDFAYGKNPGRGVAAEGITANTLSDLEANIMTRRREIGTKIGERLKAATDRGEMVKAVNFLIPLNEARAAASKAPTVNAALIARIDAAKNDLTAIIGRRKAISPNEAFDLKGVVADITKFTGNASDDKLVNKALKKVYGNIKEGINKTEPSLVPLNERYADLLSAEVATRYREAIQSRLNLIGLAPKLGIYGSMILSIGTGNIAGVLASLGLVGLEKALASPVAKTRIAKVLMQMSGAERSVLIEKYPVLKGLIRRRFK